MSAKAKYRAGLLPWEEARLAEIDRDLFSMRVRIGDLGRERRRLLKAAFRRVARKAEREAESLAMQNGVLGG